MMALLAVACFLRVPTAQAQDDAVPGLTLKKAVADIAGAVAKVVKAQNTRDLVVGLFNDNADPNHTFGVGLRSLLINQLRAEGIEPVANADICFFGSYEVGPAEVEGTVKSFPVAKVAFKVAQRNGKQLLDSKVEMLAAQFTGDQKPAPKAFRPRAAVVRDGRPFLPVKPAH